MDTATEKKEFKAPESKEDFAGQFVIEHTYENGSKVKFVLLSNGNVATIREGKGKDVERASMESEGDKTKYLSSMMAATTKINGRGITMYDLADLPMKDYFNIQVAFSELNF
jgi:hypothetical protein